MNKQKIRIAFIRAHYREDGGAEQILSRIFDGLQTTSNLSISMITQHWASTTKQNINIISCPKKGIFRHQRQENFSRCAQKNFAEEEFDLVQSHERIPGCQIYRAGDGVHKHWMELRAKDAHFLQKLLWKISPFHKSILKAEKDLLHHPNLKAVICNSEQIIKEIRQHYPSVDQKKLKLIRNGIDPKQFPLTTDETRNIARLKLGYKSEDFISLFVGSGFQRKGLSTALQALAKTRKWKLIIVGQDKKQSIYEKQCRQLGISSRVKFMGKQKNPLLFYQTANLLIHPALYDPAPNVILEAMSTGIPVICSNTSGTSELIQHNVDGYILQPNNPLELTKILNAIDTHSALTTMGKKAHSAIKYQTTETMSHQLLKTYHSLI